MANLTPNEALQAAVEHHQAGRLHEAELLYRQILHALPREQHSLHGLALIAHAMQRADLAFVWAQEAVAVAPDCANYHNTLGEIHRSVGRYPEAEQCYLRSLSLKPGVALVHNNLGAMYARMNRLPLSIAQFERAIALDPALAVAHDGLGLSLLLVGDLQRGWAEQNGVGKKPNSPPAAGIFSSLSGMAVRLRALPCSSTPSKDLVTRSSLRASFACSSPVVRG